MADNIFDDVDEILGADSIEDDKNFNESELQDIMSEIEDLEKEFEAVDAPAMSLQEKIDAELRMSLEEASEEAEMETEIEETVTAKADILPFQNTTPVPTPITTTGSGVSFAAHGQMSLNLDFMVGSESAKLTIDPVKGLVVVLSGVELCISEDSGCTVSMENGMKFTIPLSSQAISHKKKTA